MKRRNAVVFAAMLAAATLYPSITRAQAVPGPCTIGVLPSGAQSLMCVPAFGTWNGALVVFAHGYVKPSDPLGFYHLALPDRTDINLPTLVQSLGFAFATTSYRQNGLAILEGADDMRELVMAFSAAVHVPTRTYVVGVSEGALVATLLAERSPELFTSALAACGPIGSFQAQIDYFGDFRVLFDYFFPNVLPGSAVNAPAILMANWDSGINYAGIVAATLALNPDKAVELLRVAKAAFDPAKPQTIVQTAVGIIWYNVFATNDAIAKLGGNPFGNRLRWYFGSKNDLRLNFLVQRYTESPIARQRVRNYETNGELTIPLVAPHTIGDPIIPIWHELVYFAKLSTFGRTEFTPVPIARYGHCAFTTNELVAAFQAIQR
jgi:pimeloyl-ACP methyl ester carboxylesterase